MQPLEHVCRPLTVDNRPPRGKVPAAILHVWALAMVTDFEGSGPFLFGQHDHFHGRQVDCARIHGFEIALKPIAQMGAPHDPRRAILAVPFCLARRLIYPSTSLPP